MLTALQGQVSKVLHGVHKGVTYEEIVGATDDQFGDQHLAIGYHSQLKTKTQDKGEPLQEFATTVEELTHHAIPALHENYICRGPGKAFGNGIRGRGIKQQLLLGGNKALRQTLSLEIVITEEESHPLVTA
jgi:hypothetical protein